MSRRAQVCAWGLVALAFGFLLLAGAVDLSTGRSFADAISDVTGVGIVFSICFPVLGAFVIRQRGGHRVGWLLIGIGATLGVILAVVLGNNKDQKGPFGGCVIVPSGDSAPGQCN